ncbi:MAG TPA: phosphodiester glycosidase family protein [Hymenobacter sp.]|uniref:phosphodiester glycosidase family protein n=1 Tax=Hymenobacter sp. TaxID=1898978 RepID=UPI002D803D76|nr:phosphodiester glycosidase family protein [Hymenobacter sp.]HET9505779.1 phosphodiester glycosidase family protein [Hymenobacter sp.]
MQRPNTAVRFVSYEVNPQQQELRLFYQDERGRRFGSLGRLRAWLAQRPDSLAFAMNGGMYAPGGVPKGLFIENQKQLAPLDTGHGAGNFYLQPNGVFYLTTARRAGICATREFRGKAGVAYATQSGPLLLVGGRVNPLFTPGSTNVVVRNGVGLRPDGRVVFALSREPVNFYDFAAFFQRRGCREALYLDGFVSRLYCPALGWRQTDGDFGVIIGLTTPKRP